jgi:hypothetical protein
MNQSQSVRQACYIHEEEKLVEVTYSTAWSDHWEPPITSIAEYSSFIYKKGCGNEWCIKTNEFASTQGRQKALMEDYEEH